MQNYILSLEGQFPQIYSQTRSLGINSTNIPLNSGSTNNFITSTNNFISSHSSSTSSLPSAATNSTTPGTLSSTTTTSNSNEEILPNKLPLKRRLTEFRYGRDGGTLSVGKKSSTTNTNFTTNPFAFDKFKDIATAFTVHLHEDGVLLDPGSVGPLPYDHPTTLHLLNSINSGVLAVELFVSLLEQSHFQQLSLFYDGCVVVGVVEWRKGFGLTIGNVSNNNPTRQSTALQWTSRASNSTPITLNPNNPVTTTPETHKVLLKPTPDCWQYALSFMASVLPDGTKYSKILEDEESLLEFERQLILINEPLVCLDPSPMVMYAMNALYFDHFKHRMYSTLTCSKSKSSNTSVFDDLDSTLSNLAALKPTRSSNNLQTSPNSNSNSPTTNPRYRRINLIESWQEGERRRNLEPIYGIDHRRQFVKNRQPLPPSSFVPSNWRPFKTIRYEREILASSGAASGSLSRVYYCVNVFYAPPPTNPPIQLFLQIGTTPDTSKSGCLHHLTFSNLIEVDFYLLNLRNLLLIENGNCNLKVITDISTTGSNSSGISNSTTTTIQNTNANTGININRKADTSNGSTANNTNNANIANSANIANTATNRSIQQPQQQSQQQPQQYHLTPHQILQLNNQRTANTNLTTSTSTNTNTNKF